MHNAIWGSQSCLNNSYDNKLFFLVLRNQLPNNFQYQPSLQGPVGTTAKVKVFFEKMLVSFFAIIPCYRKNVRNAFTIVRNYKISPPVSTPPTGNASTPPILQNISPSGSLDNSSNPPIQQNLLSHNIPLPPSPSSSHNIPPPSTPSSSPLQAQVHKVRNVVHNGNDSGKSRSILSPTANAAKMGTLEAQVRDSCEDIISMEVMKKPVLIPCGHIEDDPRDVDDKKDFRKISDQLTSNGLPRTTSSWPCDRCRKDVSFIILSDDLATNITRINEIYGELENLTKQHKDLYEQVEKLQIQQFQLSAGNVNQAASLALTTTLPMAEAEEKGVQEFVKDPVMLLCGHIHSLDVAKSCFGKMAKNAMDEARDGRAKATAEGLPLAPKPGNCGTCNKPVVTYLNTAALRNAMTTGNELLAHKKILDDAIAVLNYELSALQNQTPSSLPANALVTPPREEHVSKELEEAEAEAIRNNPYISQVQLDENEYSEFSCNRPWTALNLEEQQKYCSEDGVKPTRWTSFTNIRGDGDSSLCYYGRVLGFENGKIKVILLINHVDKFKKLLEDSGFSSEGMNKRSRLTNTGVKKETAEFVAQTPEQIQFALSLLINNGKNKFKEPKLFTFAKRLMLNPEDWEAVEYNSQGLIAAVRSAYLADVRKARLKEQDDKAKASQKSEPQQIKAEDLPKHIAALKRFEEQKKQEQDSLAYIQKLMEEERSQHNNSNFR